MKLNILCLIMLVFISSSYAQLGDLLKSFKSDGKKSCTDDIQRECGDTYGYYTLWCLGGGEKGYIKSDKGFRKCSDFIKRCECLANTRLRNPQGNQESETDFKDRAQKIQRIKSALSTAEQNREQAQERRCSDKLQRECTQSLGSRSACDPNYDSFQRYIQTEEGFRHCSDLVKKCECWLRERENDDEMGNMGIREVLKEQAKKNATKAATEKRNQMIQDSLREEATEEIFALIDDNAEINLILDKCNMYNRSFTTLLQECKAIQDSVKITKITALLKANKLEESLEECNEQKLSITKGNECLKKCKQPVFIIDGGERRIKTNSEEECFKECGIGSSEKITDLCEKQLAAKIKKLPKNKISPKIAKLYYDNHEKIFGTIIQKTDKIILIDGNFNRYSDDKIFLFNTAMVQISGNVGACILPHYNGDSFFGNAKYLGMITYTTLLGERKTIPNYQLLWCDNLWGDK